MTVPFVDDYVPVNKLAARRGMWSNWTSETSLNGPIVGRSGTGDLAWNKTRWHLAWK